jgi:hypothetical protein
VFAFVEGDPDAAFYRTYIQSFVENPGQIFVYNCGSKAKVYETYDSVVTHIPDCVRVLFFVDKDLDDVIGQVWPTDPRIFVTEFYSIENYLVCSALVERFFTDFVKINRVDFELTRVVGLFDEQLRIFHRLLLSTMAWIVVMRRAGSRVILADVRMEALFEFGDQGVKRKKHRQAIAYLSRVTQTASQPGVWREVRRACRELRRLSPKRYIRGKFETWWVLKFIRKITDDLAKVAAESGGSIAVRVQVQESNLVQLFAGAVPCPPALSKFLKFHLARGAGPGGRAEAQPPKRGILQRILRRGH